jgi:hypothetical protein
LNEEKYNLKEIYLRLKPHQKETYLEENLIDKEKEQ